jgi:short-subunit dehydrogenase
MKLAEAGVLVTGASSGIGEALARRLAGKGARLTLSGRRADRLRELSLEIAGHAPGAARPHCVSGDLTEPGEPERLVAEAIRAWGSLDVLVNNAGISAYGPCTLLPDAEWRRLMEVNCFAPVRTTLAALPRFLERGRGTVVNVASVAALRGVPFLGAYGASKAALASWSQSLRAELHGTGVRVLVVYPGYTDTELFAKETRVGTARRPDLRRESPAEVADAMIRGLEEDRNEIVCTLSGKAMRRIAGLVPSALDRVLGAMAVRLRQDAAPGERTAS